MTAGLRTILSAVGILSILISPGKAEWEGLKARMALVTNSALNVGGVTGAEVVASRDCDIGANEVAQFNALLTLSEAEQSESKGLHGKWGLPVPTGPIADEQLLVHREYVTNYNRDLKIPIYATYLLKASDVVQASREKCFREDPRLDQSARSELADYVEPIFDRGHLVPRADMNRSKGVMINTFLLSNMMPQHDQFNQGIWETLETMVRAWATEKGAIIILSGAVFDANADGARDAPSVVKRVRPTDRVGIPTHFYKIVLHEKPNGAIDAIAILLPHTDDEVPKSMPIDKKLAYLQEHIVSIDAIESLTGYDFFPNMPAIKQQAVERSIASGLWE
jgi:endonuclease G